MIKNPEEFPDKNTQTNAEKYSKLFKDKHFVSIMHFIIGILKDLSEYSLIFQERVGLIIGKSQLIKQMIDSID